MKNFLKSIWYFLTDRCECGGRIEFDGYKDRCNKCNK
jgi:hypothetical protein